MLKAYSATDIGKKRQMNQDFLFTSELPLGHLQNLFIVADGMGGHQAGEYASKYTVETIVEEVGRSRLEGPVPILTAAINRANTYIRQRASEDITMSGMGTTVVAATSIAEKLYVANVGDSRLYIINQEIRQVTRDHSLVEEMVRMGGLDRTVARTHPDKNIITRAIGVSETVKIDFFEIDLEKDDLVLMCTDGLTNMLEDEKIKGIISQSDKDMQANVKGLIAEANEQGGKDNIAVIVMKQNCVS